MYIKKGLSYSLLNIATPHSFSLASKGNDKRIKEEGPSTRDLRSLVKRRDRGSPGRQSRLLQPSLRCTEEERQAPAGNRLIGVEPPHNSGKVQNGDDPLYTGGYPPGRVGCLHRSEGCLPSHSDAPLVQEVSSLPVRGESVSVSGASLRDKHRSFPLLETDGGSGSRRSKVRFASHTVLRRLAPSPVMSKRPSVQSEGVLANHTGTRTDSQQGQIRPGSISNFHVCGDVFPDSSGAGVRSPTKNRRHSGDRTGGTSSKGTHRQILSLTARGPQRGSGLSTAGSLTHEAPADVSPVSMETNQRSFGHRCANPPYSSSPPEVVVEQGAPVSRSAYLPTGPICHPLNRCISDRLGRPSRAHRATVSGHLDFDRTTTPHKQSGVEGSVLGNPTVTTPSTGTLRHGGIRQFHSRLLYSETGGHPLDLSMCRDSRSFAVVCETPGDTSVQAHSRSPECTGRLSVSGKKRHSLGVVTSPHSRSLLPASVGTADSRSVRQPLELQAPPLRVSGSGRSGVRSGRPISGLERHGRFRVPAFQSPGYSAQESGSVELSGDPSGPTVATEVVVQPASVSAGRDSTSPALAVRPPFSTQRSHVTSKRGVPPPSRLEALRRSVAKRGFSAKAASLIARAKRPSTSTVYDAKWKIFSNWCVERKIDPRRPSLGKVADFLIYLFEVRKCAPSTIKGYRSALSNTLKFGGGTGGKIGSDFTISELIRHFDRVRPATRFISPKWNLSCVLWSLTKAPYEPMGSASLLHSSVKTAFLLALATAKRRSELHAFSIEEGSLRFGRDSVTLRLEPGFLPKTQVPSKLPEPITVPSLDQACGPDDEDRLLCPVRALKFYIKKSAGSRLSRKRLFIPVRGGGDITPTTISRWIRMAILRAYSGLTDRNLTFLQIKAHEVRALATSWAYHNRIPSEDILQAASWLNHSTFSNFYLRSLSSQEEDLFRLGPLVAAQRVISH